VSRDSQRKEGTPLEGGALAFRPAGAVPPATPPAELTFTRAGGLEMPAGFNTVPVWVLRVNGANRVP
jgi:hypothetical protein